MHVPEANHRNSDSFPAPSVCGKIVDALRNNINLEFRVPETVAELITHYRDHELTKERKAYATIEAKHSLSCESHCS